MIKNITGLAGAAAGLTSGVLGAFSQNMHNKKLIRGNRKLMANVDEYRDRYGNEDGTQSVAFQNVLNENARRMKRATRGADMKRALGFDVDAEGQRELNAETQASLLAGAAAAQQSRNNKINDEAFAQKQALEAENNKLEAGMNNPMDVISKGIGGAAEGYKSFSGLA